MDQTTRPLPSASADCDTRTGARAELRRALFAIVLIGALLLTGTALLIEAGPETQAVLAALGEMG